MDEPISDLEARLQKHLANRPTMPRPYLPHTPEGVKFHADFTVWIRQRTSLEGAILRAKYRPEAAP